MYSNSCATLTSTDVDGWISEAEPSGNLCLVSSFHSIPTTRLILPPEGDPFTSPDPSHGPPKTVDTLTVPLEMVYPTAMSPPKDTFTPLEIDVLPHHILNRNRLKPRYLHHDFVELLHKPLDPDEKLVPAVAELWEDERRRRASKGLSLSERAMMPGSGGMGGRTMAELGYKLEGDEPADNRGGNWKISEELWAMIQERMQDERRKNGRLTFERFSADTTSGKEGERKKYDKWVMTTFQAISAHWPKQPKPPKSTGRSRKSRRTNGSSLLATSSPSRHLDISPLKREIEAKVKHEDLDNEPEEDLFHIINGHAARNGDEPPDLEEDTSDEENPFEALAMTQASQGDPHIKVEVDSREIEGRADLGDFNFDDVDDEELEQMMHQRDAKQHAQESAKIHATQQMAASQDSTEQFDDEELDELFKKHVASDWVGWETPTKSALNGLFSPSTGSRTALSSSGGGLDSRRAMRDRRMRELAGLGDLSTIIDRSSITLSSPYDNTVRTPTNQKTPVKGPTTPTSMVKNLFARNRTPGSPLKSPFKRPGTGQRQNTVVLPETRRSLGNLSPSPEDEEREATPTPIKPKVNGHAIKMEDVKPDLETLKRQRPPEDHAIPLPPPQVRFKDSMSSGESHLPTGSKRFAPSPTLHNTPGSQDDLEDGEPTQSSQQPKKRVRLASPSSGLQPTPVKISQNLPEPQASGESLTSTSTGPAVFEQMNVSDSTVRSDLSSTAWQFHLVPPDRSVVVDSIDPEVVYRDPFYSFPPDVPTRPKMFAGRMFTLKGNGVHDLLDFESTVGESRGWLKTRKEAMLGAVGKYGWEYGPPPPTRNNVRKWCLKEDAEARAACWSKFQVFVMMTNIHRSSETNRSHFSVSQAHATQQVWLQILSKEEDQRVGTRTPKHVSAGHRGFW